MDVLALAPLAHEARFFVVTRLHSRALDIRSHVAIIQLVSFRDGNLVSVASTPPYNFVYSYDKDPSAPGLFTMTTEFNLNLLTLGALGTFWVQLSVDEAFVEQTPITLLRKS